MPLESGVLLQYSLGMTEKEVKQITDAMTKVFFKWLESPEFDAKVEKIIHRVLGEYTSEVVESSYTILYEKIDELEVSVRKYIADLKQDVAVLKQDVHVLKQDVAALKQDMGILKQKVTHLEQDIAILKEDVADLKQDMRLVKRALSSQTS